MEWGGCLNVQARFSPEPEFNLPVPIGGLAGVLRGYIARFFQSYYERHRSEASHEGPWRMGWVIRNGFAHDGCVEFKARRAGHQPVTWRDLMLSPEDNGKPIMDNILAMADIIVLLLDMEEQRNGESLPFAEN